MKWTLAALLGLLLPACGDAAACCRQALAPRCATWCKSAKTAKELELHCRRSDETELFRCVRGRKPGKDGTEQTEEPLENDDLLKARKCCRKALTPACRRICADLLESTPPADGRDALKRLRTGPCRQEHAAFWSCQGGGPEAADPPLHQLELQCCHLAETDRCRRLCLDSYGPSWHDCGPTFERECLTSEYGEPRLRRCVRDAEEPCQPNSGPLRFCRGLTDESMALFRRWDQRADDHAKTQYINWKRAGMIDVPLRNLSILTAGPCEEMLKRLACFIHLKPCQPEDHSVEQICRSDCLRLAESCLNPHGGVTDHGAFCTLLAAPEPHCVRILPPGGPVGQISSPCLSSPCEVGKVCRVGHPNQAPYVCIPGCRLSTVSGRRTGVGSTVLLPPIGSSNKLSLLMCAPGGHLVECTSIEIPHDMPCYSYGRKIGTGTAVRRGCERCLCVDGALVCQSTEECAKATRPAGVPPASSCVQLRRQRCAGAAPPSDVCETLPCPRGFRCLPEPELCVDSVQPCGQRTCVPESTEVIDDALSACRQSVVYVASLEQSTWSRPYAVCPAEPSCANSDTPCKASADCIEPQVNCSNILPSCGRSLKLYFSGRRLAALGTQVPVRAVLAAVRRLVSTADCLVTGRLEAARLLTVTLSADGAAPARACALEANKLRAWLVAGSPAASVEPSLWPVVYAELVPEPRSSRAAAGAGWLVGLVVLAAAAARLL